MNFIKNFLFLILVTVNFSGFDLSRRRICRTRLCHSRLWSRRKDVFRFFSLGAVDALKHVDTRVRPSVFYQIGSLRLMTMSRNLTSSLFQRRDAQYMYRTGS